MLATTTIVVIRLKSTPKLGATQPILRRDGTGAKCQRAQRVSTYTLSVEKIPVVMLPLGAPEAIFLTGKLIDRHDFNRNLLNRSNFCSIFALDIPLFRAYVTHICIGKTDISLFSGYVLCTMHVNALYNVKFAMYKNQLKFLNNFTSKFPQNL